MLCLAQEFEGALGLAHLAQSSASAQGLSRPTRPTARPPVDDAGAASPAQSGRRRFSAKRPVGANRKPDGGRTARVLGARLALPVRARSTPCCLAGKGADPSCCRILVVLRTLPFASPRTQVGSTCARLRRSRGVGHPPTIPTRWPRDGSAVSPDAKVRSAAGGGHHRLNSNSCARTMFQASSSSLTGLLLPLAGRLADAPDADAVGRFRSGKEGGRDLLSGPTSAARPMAPPRATRRMPESPTLALLRPGRPRWPPCRGHNPRPSSGRAVGLRHQPRRHLRRDLVR